MYQASHSYEELRSAIVEILAESGNATSRQPMQWNDLTRLTAMSFRDRGEATTERYATALYGPTLSVSDLELARDVFWDLFRQGIITLGFNDSNPTWPFFRVSHLGRRMLSSDRPWRFHDTTTYVTLLLKAAPDVSQEVIQYAEEAVASFYANCLLSSCVMLGVAAEAEFLRLAEVAAASQTFGGGFKAVLAERLISHRIRKFRVAMQACRKSLPQAVQEGLDESFDAIQGLIRRTRNDAGHPSTFTPDREQVFVQLHLLIPFLKMSMGCRQALGAA